MSSREGQWAIERLLKWAPPGKVNTNKIDSVGDWPSFLEALASAAGEPNKRYDLAIAEFWLPGGCAFEEIYAADPKCSVIDVNLLKGTSNTPMFNVGSEKLRRLAEWLTREAGLTSAPAAMGTLVESVADETAEVEEVEEVEEAEEAQPSMREDGVEVPETLAPQPPPWPRLVPSSPAEAEADAPTQLADLARWIALKLGLMLARTESHVPGQDFPGWAMSATRVRALLGGDIAQLPPADLSRQWQEVDLRIESYVRTATRSSFEVSLGWLCRSLELDSVGRQMLYWAAAPDIAGCFAQAIGFLNDNMTQCRPSPSLLSLLIEGAGPPWQIQRRLGGNGLLAHFRLLAIAKPDPLVPESLAPIVAPPDLVAMLLGRRPADAVEGMTGFDPADYCEETFDLQVAPVLRAARAADRECDRPVVHFQAQAADADWLAAQLASVGERALVGDLAPLAGASFADAQSRLIAFARAARAADAVLILTGIDEHEETRRARLMRTIARDLASHLKLLVVQGTQTAPTALRAAPGGVIDINRPRPTREERASIWMQAAAARAVPLSDADARDMAATFAFDRVQADTAIALAVGAGATDPTEPNSAAVRDAARVVSRASAPPSVTRVDTGLGWDDLILPAPIKAELRSIVAQVRSAALVWDDWGFGERIPYGQAVTALLAGPSGTGKTKSARVIASELGTPLLQIDVPMTMSKYIGETEKAVDAAFKAGEDTGAVLLFDEADALFGKRTEIRDAHDRYANIEVSYLLQRIEQYRGIVLLTTNRKANIDPAFARRFKVIEYSMPSEADRELIARHMLPPEAPIDPEFDPSLFGQLPLSGGGIVNSILTAAFIAAEDGGVIMNRHLIAGARSELVKCGMESAGRGLTHLIKDSRTAGGEP